MELVFNEIALSMLSGSATSQALVEGALPLPLEHPEAESVLLSEGNVSIISAEALEGRIMLDGTLSVDIIALSPEGEAFSFRSKSSFRHAIPVKDAVPTMRPSIQAVLQTLSCIPDNSGNITLSAIVDLYCRVNSHETLKAVSSVKTIDDLEAKNNLVTTAHRTGLGEASVRIREEIESSGITRMLYSHGSAYIKSVMAEDGKAIVEGILSVAVLALGEGNRLIELVKHMPFSELCPLGNDYKDGPLEAEAQVVQLQVRVVGDEFALLSCEALINISLSSIETCQASIMSDCYAPGQSLECVLSNGTFFLAHPRISRAVEIVENISVPKNLPECERPVFAAARSVVTSRAARDGRMTIDGLAFLTVLYECIGGKLHSFIEEVPFLLELTVPSDTSDADVFVDCVGIKASGRGASVEAAYTLNIVVEPYTITNNDYVSNIKPTEAKAPPRGIAIYFAGQDETAWDIAKRFSMPMGTFLASNPNGPYQEGEKLVLFLKRGA